MSKKLTLAQKIEKQYSKYSSVFNERKKAGVIKAGQRKLGKRQFQQFVEKQLQVDSSLANARHQLEEAQYKFGDLSEAKLKKAYEIYKSNGNRVSNTYWGYSMAGRGGVDNTPHEYRTFESFKAGIKPHQVIALLVDAGYSQEQAIEEYGY